MVGIAGLAAALDELNPPEALTLVRTRLARFHAGLEEIPGIRRLASAGIDQSVGVCSLVVDGLGVEEVGAILDESFDIAVRTGLHCAPYVHQQLGTFPDGAVRVSPGPFTTEDEIDQAIAALTEIAQGV
jgi:selenocysteine lyase/cysteine desulfurase